MRESFIIYAKKSLGNFGEAVFNLFIFFPYFFSVSALLKTLFSPWKNLVTKKVSLGFSFEESLSAGLLNFISRSIGLIMRLSILFFYFILQLLYVILLPFVVGIFILLLPVRYLIYQTEMTDDQKKTRLKEKFFSAHLLNQENLVQAGQWFEWYYRQYYHKKRWYKLSNLFCYPPLARDWAVGFTPTLDQYTEDLNNPNYQKRTKNIVDRKKEISQIEAILSKNKEANVVIVGQEGVGKHTVIDALAKKIYEGQTNPLLVYKRLLKLKMEKILTAFTDQKRRENFLEDLFEEAVEAKNVILVIEDLDKYTSFDQGRVDLSAAISKYGSSPFIQFVGITNPFSYEKFIYTNDKIQRIFTKVNVGEIDKQEAETILLQTVPLFETRNHLTIPYETVRNTVEKSDFYITRIPFPEKAIELLDKACSYCYQNRIPTVLPDIIDKILTQETHIPTKLTEDLKQKLVNLETDLNARIVFQEEAVGKLSAAMERSFIQLGKRKKPLASFLFLGATGVGKTETAKALAETFFGGQKFLIRFDMSLYQNKSTIPQLVGSPEEKNPGLLPRTIRETPYAVLLLDEIEKADRDLLNIFLTVLDEGYFTDGFGRRVDCKNLIIIATSNAGADLIYKNLTDKSLNPLSDYLVGNHIFSPEFLNRFDGVVQYKPLGKDALFTLAKKMIRTITENLYKLYKIKIDVYDETLKNLVAHDSNPGFGARNLDRLITQELETKISKLILENKVKEGDTIRI